MEPQTLRAIEGIEEVEHSISDDRARSSSVSSASVDSASSDFSFEDPYQIDSKNEHGSFAVDHDDDHIETNGTIGDTSISSLETPKVQVMERPPDADTSGYRIPSYVFATKSGTPNPEWSTASNESLFSIHTGNMSFTRDQFSWLLKSGELGMYGPGGDIRKSGELGLYGPGGDIRKSGELGLYGPGDIRKSGELGSYGHGELGMYGPGDIRKSGELPPPSPKFTQKPKIVELPKSEELPPPPQDTSKPGEQIIANHFKAAATPPPPVVNKADVEVVSNSPKVTEVDVNPGPKKDEIKLEVKSKKKGRSAASDEVPFSASASHHSDASGQSFAFPVLAEIDREKSVNSGQSRAERQKNSISHRDPETPKSPTSAPTQNPTASWFSRFACCSCC